MKNSYFCAKELNLKVKIENHIRELLYDHNFVIVPGLGAFVTKYKPAEVDFQGQKILPPTKKIYFNDSIKEDDGLLINYLCHNTELTREEGYELIENYVKDVENRLSVGKTIEIDNLGHLELNMNKKKEFKNDKSGNLLLESFGLPIVEFSGSEEINEIKDEKKISGSIRPNKKAVNVKPKAKQPEKKANLWIYIFSILVLLSLAYLAYEFGLFNKWALGNHFSNNNTLQTSEEIKLGPDGKSAHDDPSTRKIENALESQTSRAKALAPDNKQGTAQTARAGMEKNGVKYHLIAGSFLKYPMAEELMKSLLARGYKSKIIKGENGRYRVTFNSYSSKEEALDKLKLVKEKENNPSVWILKHSD